MPGMSDNSQYGRRKHVKRGVPGGAWILVNNKDITSVFFLIKPYTNMLVMSGHFFEKVI